MRNHSPHPRSDRGDARSPHPLAGRGRAILEPAASPFLVPCQIIRQPEQLYRPFYIPHLIEPERDPAALRKDVVRLSLLLGYQSISDLHGECNVDLEVAMYVAQLSTTKLELDPPTTMGAATTPVHPETAFVTLSSAPCTMIYTASFVENAPFSA